MKMYNKLIIISMIIISLLAIGVASASENVTDVVKTSDFEELISVEDNSDNSISLENENCNISADENIEENSEILSMETEKKADLTYVEETEIIKDNSTNQRFNWTTLYNKNNTEDLLIFDLSPLLGKNNTGSSILAVNKDNLNGSSYLILGLSDFLCENSAYNNSYLVVGLNSILGENKTGDDSFLVLDLPELGINKLGNSTLILDLTNLLSENCSSEESFLNMKIDDDLSIPFNLSEIYKNNVLMGVNLTAVSQGNYTELISFLETFEWGIIFDEDSEIYSFLSNLNWTAVFDGNYTNLTSSLNNINWTAILKNNTEIIKFLDNLNWTTLFNENYTNLITSLNNINWTAILKNNTEIIKFLDNLNWTALFDGNYTNLISSLNAINWTAVFNSILTDWISYLNNMNWTSFINNNTGNLIIFLSNLNCTTIFKENNTEISKFLDNLNWTMLFDENYNNLKSLLNNVNWTSLLKENELNEFLSDLNLTDIFNGNFTSLQDSLNKINISGIKLSDIVSFINNQNITSEIVNFLTGIFRENTTHNNTDSDWWSDIFNKTYYNTRDIVNNLIDLITGKTSQNTTNQTKTSVSAVKNSIKSNNLNTYYDTTTTFKVTVMSGSKAVTGGKVIFTIKNKKYTVKIGSNGVTVLKLKLTPGTYSVTSTYGKVSVKNKIVVKKSIITKNVSKKYKKTGKFSVKVLNSKGKPQSNQKVKIKIKGKSYIVKTNKNGIATFKLSKTLKVGKYTIKTTCKGLTLSNKITVKR